MSNIYHTFFFNPLYNSLIALFSILPWADAGVVVIILTILVRFVLFPLSRKAVHTQIKMQEIGPELEKIKSKYKDNQEEMARKTLELYREKGVNPFSGIFVIIIQIPVIIALYQIFLHAGLPEIDTTILYEFIKVPENINTTFLGIMDITAKSIPLAILAAVTTFIQFVVSMRNQKAPQGNSFGDNLARSMQMQMKYIFPVIVFFISYHISGVIALYWFTTNVFTILQDIVIRKRLAQAKA
jgi:YidC/Oxa1 family membrane protein insertase